MKRKIKGRNFKTNKDLLHFVHLFEQIGKKKNNYKIEGNLNIAMDKVEVQSHWNVYKPQTRKIWLVKIMIALSDKFERHVIMQEHINGVSDYQMKISKPSNIII